MTIPAAEEHEIISRFHKLGIPIFHARHISAIHNHHLELDWLVDQQYKYGLATAEAFAKHPEISEVKQFAELKSNLDNLSGKRYRKLAKRILASSIGRKATHFCAKVIARFSPNGNHNWLFGLTTTASFWGGYKRGRNQFKC